MTPTPETALAGLPAKPRVHELSKRIGISNKQLLAALAERGLSITSASASVPLPVAHELITALLGGGDDTADGTGPAPAGPAAAGAEPPAADAGPPPILGDTPGSAGLAINPLFLPPADVAPTRPSRRRRPEPEPDAAESTEPAEPVVTEQPQAEPDAEAPPSGGRRRRGRSGKGRRGGSDRNEQDRNEQARNEDDRNEGDRHENDRPADLTEHHDGGDGGRPTAGPSDGGADGADTPSPGAEPGPTGEAADRAGDESDDELSARGRRRRRGRRGRGRVSDDDEQSDGPTGDVTGDEDAATAAPEDTSADDSSNDRSDSGADSGADTDADDGQSGPGNRRRRRRRRRANGDEVAREDDPDNTVVHVREPRLSQAATGGASSGSSEVQGVRGSTRLEAKRQRRRDSRDSSRRRPQILTEAEFLARRESVERVMAVRQRGGLAQVALLEDGILVEHFVSQTGSDSMIGSVFLGKVQNVLPSMEAAFVDIGRGRNAVIYAGEVNWDAAGLNGKARRIETALSSGDTILAQVSKDPVGHKGARLTTQISLPGRFVVYVPGGGATGISRKLPDTERKRLKSIMDRIVPEDAGVIIRTAAEGIAEDELARDVERLKAQWDEITRRAAEKTSAPTQLYAEPGTLIKVVRDLFNSDITRLVVDGDDAYEPVAEYINAVAPELADRLVRYESTPKGPDVFTTYRVDEQIAKALERKVHLPSGGSLVIDRTEAMTVVDVNTGKYTGSGGNLEETVTKNNLEAAEEIVRQLRLRDIGGIIVVDFIDMVLESNRELVLRRLTEALGRDRTRHQVAEVTSLGLVQMTRKRMGTGLVEAFSEPCPHCAGRGIVLHDMPMVAALVDDGAPERRTGKSRRSRGREERTEEIVVPRVVEQTPGRRPDPRGPKPPTAAVVELAPAAADRGPVVEDRPLVGRTAELGVDADEVDWIEAAATAGIAAADAADADDFEFGEPTADDAAKASPRDVGDADNTADSEADDAADNQPDGKAGDEAEGTGNRTRGRRRSRRSAAEAVVGAVEVPTGPSEESVDSAGDSAHVAEGNGAVHRPEPASSAPSAAPEGDRQAAAPPERRRRRAAGRPAGAPSGASGPVDIIVPEPVTAAPVDATAPVDVPAAVDRPSSGDGAAEQGNAQGATTEPAVTAPGSTAPVDGAAPRRRRAASRPAGPAAGAGGEPLVLTVPADRSS